MPASSSDFRRHHHLCIAMAKHVFLKADGTLAIANPPIRIDDARRLGLEPLVLFAVCTYGAAIYWAKLAPANSVPSVTEVLGEAWETAAGLRGRPDAVIVTEQVAAAAPALRASLEAAGIGLLVGTDSKAHAAILRTMQDRIAGILGRAEPKTRLELSKVAADVELYHSVICAVASSGAQRKYKEWWLELPPRDAPQSGSISASPIELGNWTTSWELTLPPTRPLMLNDRGGIIHVMERRDNRATAADNVNLEEENAHEDNIAPVVKRLLECWPNSLAEVADAIGTTLRQLQWFLAGREDLALLPYQRLLEMLSLESDDDGDMFTKGPHVFLAKGSGRAAVELFSEITRGDQQYSFEVIPLSGTPDPSFRYILFARNFQPQSPFILTVPRGSPLTQNLSKSLLNLRAEPRPVSEAFYRDLVATCGRACLDSARNRDEAAALARRHAKLLMEEFAQPLSL